jgi:hypothetical protein
MKKVVEPLFVSKLTKNFFMELPNSVYVASNLINKENRGIFEGNTLPEKSRLEQWHKIIEVGADQRKCLVFKNKAAYDCWALENFKR